MEILSERELDLAKLSLFPSLLTPLPFTVWVIYSAEMAPTDKQFSALKEQVASLRDSVQAIQPGGSPVPWVNRHPTIAWLISGLIAALALVLTFYTVIEPHLENDFSLRVGKQISDSLSPANQKISTIEGNVATINGRLEALGPLISGLILEKFRRNAGLSKEEFQKQLPETRRLISLARQERIEIDPTLIRRIGQKLLSVRPRAQEFWAASADFVSYRSANGASEKTKQLASRDLAECTDSEPSPMKILSVPDEHHFTTSVGYYENCRFTLDSPGVDERINSILQNRIPFLTFRNCLIVYRGGPVRLIISWNNRPSVIYPSVPGKDLKPIPAPISGNAIEFEDCLFDFTIKDVPPPDGQRIAETLLAQNATTLTLPGR